ncbi:hypothetical protein BH11PLA1_BH11PLA1_06980 [soil metagenome]
MNDFTAHEFADGHARDAFAEGEPASLSFDTPRRARERAQAKAAADVERALRALREQDNAERDGADASLFDAGAGADCTPAASGYSGSASPRDFADLVLARVQEHRPFVEARLLRRRRILRICAAAAVVGLGGVGAVIVAQRPWQKPAPGTLYQLAGGVAQDARESFARVRALSVELINREANAAVATGLTAAEPGSPGANSISSAVATSVSKGTTLAARVLAPAMQEFPMTAGVPGVAPVVGLLRAQSAASTLAGANASPANMALSALQRSPAMNTALEFGTRVRDAMITPGSGAGSTSGFESGDALTVPR